MTDCSVPGEEMVVTCFDRDKTRLHFGEKFAVLDVCKVTESVLILALSWALDEA